MKNRKCPALPAGLLDAAAKAILDIHASARLQKAVLKTS